MGWHTLKRQKSAQKVAAAQQQQQQQLLLQQQQLEIQKKEAKKAEKSLSIKQKYSLKEKNYKNLTIEKPPSPLATTLLRKRDSSDDVFADEAKVQTLLARALYDNNADAPDELSIRKGDIVTVIEKDIDGLTGWWLCLLHGQQGIVPGNRLKVIPPVDLDQFERKSSSSKNRASYETDEHSDSLDAIDGIGGAPPSNYDYLPQPVKTPGFAPSLSIKDMFDIPFKSTKKSAVDVQEVYDVPSSLNTTQEIYDTPSNRSSANLSHSNTSIPSGYDSPNTGRKQYGGPTEVYDVPSNLSSSNLRNSNNSIPSGYDSPNTGRKQYGGPTEVYDVPSNLSSGNLKQSNSSIPSGYDSPNTGRKQYGGPTELYDVPSNRNSGNLSQSNTSIPSGYDSPNTGKEQYGGPTELYDVPSNLISKPSPPRQPEPYRVPNNISAQNGADELYDVPKSKRSIDMDELMGEILDSPFNVDPAVSTIKRTPSNSSTPRSSIALANNTEAEEFYDVPKQNGQANNARKNVNLQAPASSTMSHTLPRGFSPRNKKTSPYSTPKGTPTRLQEIYDIPSTHIVQNRSLPGTPLSARKPIEMAPHQPPATQQEIYDVPVPRNNDPTSNPEFLSMLHQLERQESSSFSNNKRSSGGSVHSTGGRSSQEFYDVPSIQSARSVTSNRDEISQYQNTSQQEYANSSYHHQEFYDVPSNKTNTLPAAGEQDELYDIPPARNTQTLGRPTKLNLQSGGHDSNSFSYSSKTSTPRTQEIYQTPPTSYRGGGQDIYDIPPPLSNSNSANTTQEIYMTPPTSSRLTAPSPTVNRDIYDVPPPNRSPQPQNEIYDVPPPSLSNKNTTPQQEIYDVPSLHDVNQVMADAYKSQRGGGGQRNHNNNLLAVAGQHSDDDYVDYQDIWSREPPRELMQQHAKNISGKDGSSRPPSSGSPTTSVNKRLSSGGSDASVKKSVLDQINFEAVKELTLTVSEAVDRLSKLHLAVDTCVQTLKCFHVDSWLEIALLRSTIPAIRDFSGKLKTALRLLTEFGLGTLVNTTNNINGEALMDKIIGDVEPLLESYYKIKICLMHLDSHTWTVPSNRNSTNDKFFATLNAIMILSERIPDQCRAFTLAVQNNASELFNADPPPLVDKLTSQVRDMGVNAYISPTAKYPPQPQQKVQLLAEPVMSAEALRKELAGRRQQARDATLRSMPRIPPKPTLPNQRRSLAGMMEPGEMTNPRHTLANKGGYGHIERLVTEYQPENTKQKKYASDPTTPSHTTAQNTMWGGSCPVLLDRNSAGATSSSLHYTTDTTASSCSSVGASIPEETIEIKQTDITKNYPSDSNLISPTLTPMHQRSASLPWDDKLKNVFSFDDNGPKSPTISPLDHRDIESLEFFCRQVESQVLLLRESMKNLTEAVENREEPVVFVSHSKFIILTAHKVVHSGQEISARLLNADIKFKIKDNTSHLTVCIRGVVAATKTAALDYPEPNSMMEMISSVLALGDAVRIIHSECRQALNA